MNNWGEQNMPFFLSKKTKGIIQNRMTIKN